MSASASLIPELEDVIQSGSAEQRAETVRRIANLFIDRAAAFNEDHVGLFDDVLCRLVAEIEAKSRSEIAQSLAPVANAPTELMHRFARDEDIGVAGPVISQSPRLGERELVELAKTRGQAHLAALAGRSDIGEAITDVLVRRGNPEVVLTVADNQSAKFSDGGFSALVKRAEGEEGLAQSVGSRPDIPPHLFRELLVRAAAVVQQRLLASAKPETRAEIQRVLDKISREYDKSVPVRDYTAAIRIVMAMHRTNELGESELAQFANDRKFEETVAALAALCGIPVETADRLMAGDRPDPILILAKAAGYGWDTVKAIILVRPSPRGTSVQSLEDCHADYERLPASTAQRVVRFWQVRPPDED